MGLEVRWYGLAYLAGFFIAIHFGRWLWNERSLNPTIDKATFDNFVFGTFLAGVIGGRLGLFLFYSPMTFFTDPLEIFKLWHGGMSIHGGLTGAAAWGLWQCRKHGWKPLQVADVFMLPLAIGLFLGRITNFINGELVGRITDQTWGVIFPHFDGLLRHPSQLYAAAKNMDLAILLFIMIKLNAFKRPGLLTAAMLIGYGVLRFIIEFFREPEIYWGPFTTGQALCIIMITIGVGLLCRLRVQSE